MKRDALNLKLRLINQHNSWPLAWSLRSCLKIIIFIAVPTFYREGLMTNKLRALAQTRLTIWAKAQYYCWFLSVDWSQRQWISSILCFFNLVVETQYFASFNPNQLCHFDEERGENLNALQSALCRAFKFSPYGRNDIIYITPHNYLSSWYQQYIWSSIHQ